MADKLQELQQRVHLSPTLRADAQPYTPQVQLDISYKAKIDAGAVVLCTAEVESLEGRKLWMKVGWQLGAPLTAGGGCGC